MSASLTRKLTLVRLLEGCQVTQFLFKMPWEKRYKWTTLQYPKSSPFHLNMIEQKFKNNLLFIFFWVISIYQVGKFIQYVATFLGGFIIAFIKGWLLTLVLLSSLPPLVFAGSLLTCAFAKMASRGQAAYSEAATVVDRTIGSIRTVCQSSQRTLHCFFFLV